MSEIADRAIEYMPYIGAVTGAAIGAVSEAVAVHRVAREQEAVAAALGDVVQEQHESIMRRASRIGRSTLVGLGMVAGTLNGVAWQPETMDATPPFLGVVVDHSGAVGSNPDVLESVDALAVGVDARSIDATAYVAAFGEVKPMEPNEVKNKEAFGDAPLEAALTTAFGQAQKARVENQNPNARAGVLLITNGNLPGSIDTVITTAKTDKTPVFVANVEGESDPAVVEQLKRVAKESEGAYFDVAAKKTEAMATKIEETLDKNIQPQEQPNRWPLKAAAGAMTLWAFAAGFRNRRKEPTQYELTEEDL